MLYIGSWTESPPNQNITSITSMNVPPKLRLINETELSSSTRNTTTQTLRTNSVAGGENTILQWHNYIQRRLRAQTQGLVAVAETCVSLPAPPQSNKPRVNPSTFNHHPLSARPFAQYTACLACHQSENAQIQLMVHSVTRKLSRR